MRRRNIREELELLDQLGDHPEPAARIRRRLEVMLDQYEPQPRTTPSQKKSPGRVAVDVIVLLAASALAVQFWDPKTTWQSFGLGALIAVPFMVVDGWIDRRRDRAEQDHAVATLEAAIPGLESDVTGTVTSPSESGTNTV